MDKTSLLHVFVTAKIKGKDDARQGFIICTNPLIIKGVTGTKYECEGSPTIVSNPPFVNNTFWTTD